MSIRTSCSPGDLECEAARQGRRSAQGHGRVTHSPARPTAVERPRLRALLVHCPARARAHAPFVRRHAHTSSESCASKTCRPCRGTPAPRRESLPCPARTDRSRLLLGPQQAARPRGRGALSPVWWMRGRGPWALYCGVLRSLSSVSSTHNALSSSSHQLQ